MSFAAPDNLVLYLDAQSGTSSNYYADGTWYDISGGTAHNASHANATHFPDISNHNGTKYYDFDGTGDFFTIGTTTDLQFGSNDFSVSFWFKGGGVDNGYVIRRGAWGTDGWYIYYQGSSQRELQFYTNDSTDATDTARNTDSNALTTGVWYYAVVVKSGTTANWYLNGVESTLSHDGNGMIPPKDNASRIAYISDAGSSELNGALANLMIYDVALSADQIVQNYNYFKHRFGK